MEKWGTITERRRLNGIKPNFQSEKSRDTRLLHTLADAARHGERGKDSPNKITGETSGFAAGRLGCVCVEVEGG